MKKSIYLVVVMAFGLTAGVASGKIDPMVKINFQPLVKRNGASFVPPVPEGYIEDHGLPFQAQNGLEYGFDVDIWKDNINDDTWNWTRWRNKDDDFRYDTIIMIQDYEWVNKPAGPERTWEIALPPDLYNIFIVCGDASNTDQVNTLDVEGTIALDPNGFSYFDEHTLTRIEVTDGRLTIKPADPCSMLPEWPEEWNSFNAKLAFIHIVRSPGPKNPLRVDPNVMTVYETGETVGNFDVSLLFPPLGQGGPSSPQGTPYTITVTIDPNGGNGGWGEGTPSEKDIQLLGDVGDDNQITLTFDQNNWNVPQTVVFKALEDDVPEPPELIEITDIGITITSTVAEPNLNGRSPLDLELNPWAPGDPRWNRNKSAEVMDNDQPNILFSWSGPESNTPKNPVTGPVQIGEQPRYQFGSPYIKWKKIWVTLQLPPLIDNDPCKPTEIKLNVVVKKTLVDDEALPGGDNLPLTDPNLPYAATDDPNGMIFTAANYNVSQSIKIWGNDDAVLQASGGEEGDYPSAEGNQNYYATVVVTVIDDGGDIRWTDMVREVQVEIADNECGAWGISYLDIGNPNAFTDPNYRDEKGNPLPDCYVDIYDVIETAIQWLDCSDPKVAGCESYLEE